MCVHCYKLAGEENRHKILKALKKSPANVGEIAGLLNISQPTATHHLKLLHDAGLVVMEKRGREHRYSLHMSSECIKDCGLMRGI